MPSKSVLSKVILTIIIPALFLFFVLTFGCKEEEIGLIFSHKKHTEVGGEIELACETCHQIAENGVKFTIPTHNECSSCHSIEEGQPSEACLMCHLRTAKKVQVKKKEEKKFIIEDIIFSHQIHADIGFDCDNCHKKIRKITKTPADDIPVMDLCLNCHKEKKASLECKTCHKKIREGARPKYNESSERPISHDSMWGLTHGKDFKDDGRVCYQCHQKTACDDCHVTQKPKSHSLTWKQAVHGRFVTMDRNKCAVCHEADFCSRCHQQKPTTHFIPNFIPRHRELARTNARSCIVCHERNFCMQCHILKFDRLVK